ncbi:hypothetical protein MKW94_016358 [Papaver nudicaule]|uniref:Uncharacterized protein n=1 Tax=Papaver nudicaule TaxID=74823 RepID=A0AA41SD59_PAPNU|nr:hypothetical protein [Papaver nudicaule]
MQTLDARHIELFLTEGCKNGSWDYKEIGSYQIRTHSDGATGAVFDIKHLKDRATTGNIKTWKLKPYIRLLQPCIKMNQNFWRRR